MPSKPRIAALGYYGFRNLGDEAVLAGIRQSLCDKLGDIDFLVLSNDPAETMRFHPGVRAANRWQWREAAAALRGTDLFVFGGGSLLQDATSVQSVVWYGLMALMARRRSRRVLWWGQGVGPLQSGVSRRIVAAVARQADALTVRDPASAELLRSLGGGKSVEVVADPAFALHAGASASAASGCVLALRRWRNDRVAEIGLIEALQQALPSGEAIRPIAMHLPADRTFLASIEGAPSAPDWSADGSTIADMLASVARTRFVAAMRLHALIFAAICGVPFLALSYDPKVDALAKAAGQENMVLSVESMSGEDVRARLERMQQSYATRRAHLQTYASEQKIRASRPAEIASGLLA